MSAFNFFKEDTIIKIEHQINNQIRDKEVRVINYDGTQLGIMSSVEANKKAEELGFDLEKISPNAVPPVCKIMDYGKFKFELNKREKEAKKNQKIVEVKEIRLQGKNSRNFAIGEHDIEFKAKNAIKFLKSGNKVKLSILMRGRQTAYSEKGVEIIENFAKLLEEFGQKEKPIGIEGRSISVIIAPKSNKK